MSCDHPEKSRTIDLDTHEYICTDCTWRMDSEHVRMADKIAALEFNIKAAGAILEANTSVTAPTYLWNAIRMLNPNYWPQCDCDARPGEPHRVNCACLHRNQR